MSHPTTSNIRSSTWQFEPSLPYDALCLLGILTGDPFYLVHYQETYDLFAPQLPPDAKKALKSLKYAIKDEYKGIISAFLTLYFSVTHSETLDDLLGHVEDSMQLHAGLKKSAYYTQGGWLLFEKIRPDLDTLLHFLQSVEFDTYWKAKVRSLILEKIDHIRPMIHEFNILDPIRKALGFHFPANTIVVYLLYYIAPHVIKLDGTQSLNDFANPPKVIVRTTVHELMHPPYNWDADNLLRASLEQYQQDDFVMESVLHHNPAFGYNTFAAYVEENVVQALDQTINDAFGIAIDPRERWRRADDGMHRLAVAFYAVMKKHDFLNAGITIRDFLVKLIDSGELAAGRVKPIYDNFYVE